MVFAFSSPIVHEPAVRRNSFVWSAKSPARTGTACCAPTIEFLARESLAYGVAAVNATGSVNISMAAEMWKS